MTNVTSFTMRSSNLMDGIVVIVPKEMAIDEACSLREEVRNRFDSITKEKWTVHKRKFLHEWQSKEEAMADCKKVFDEVFGCDVTVIDPCILVWV
jgi:hypothetical protein